MVVKTFSSKSSFIKETIDFISDICEKKRKKMCIRIGLSGGSTPKPIYQAMAKRIDIPFEKIKFFEVDERYIDKKNTDSNYNMIYKTLIKPLKKEKNFFYFDTNLKIADSIKNYEKIIKTERMDGFDLIILGIGEDGHTASLFPNSKALKEKKALTAHTATSKFAIKDRLTLTFPFILKSKEILLLLNGKNKRKILNELLNSKKSTNEIPAKALLKNKNLKIFFLEK